MYGPDSGILSNPGFGLAWEEERRFIFTDAIVGDLEPGEPFMIGIWSIEADGGGMRYTTCARHWSAEAYQQQRDMGFDTGWGARVDQLKALAESRA